jgi:hypothetical protein
VSRVQCLDDLVGAGAGAVAYHERDVVLVGQAPGLGAPTPAPGRAFLAAPLVALPLAGLEPAGLVGFDDALEVPGLDMLRQPPEAMAPAERAARPGCRARRRDVRTPLIMLAMLARDGIGGFVGRGVWRPPLELFERALDSR